MEYSFIIFILIVLSKNLNPLGNTISICSNSSTGEPLICCPNYRKVGENCEECWPGTYDTNCVPCPKGFYGRFCILSCHNLCTSCDPVTGCTTSSPESLNGNGNEISWLTIAISVSGSCGAGLIVLMFIYCKHRKRSSKRDQDEETAKSTADTQLQISTNYHSKRNEPVVNHQKQHDSNNENEHSVDLEPYDTLTLKIREDLLNT